MQSEFWHERWQKNEIGFHQAGVNSGLEKLWGTLALPAGCEVFVPLCGKSLDMHWLASAGHSVLGVELSEIAARAFFAEAGLVPRERHDARFKVFEHPPFKLLCGDFFALTATELTNVRGVYDRAALVALPPDMRRRYAQALIQRLPRAVAMLLVTFEYEQTRMEGPPHAVSFAEVQTLYADAFAIELLFDSGRSEAPPPFKARGLDWVAELTMALRR